ncbi:MAG: hypothetical protein ABFC94_15705 [Syntrophomonas sp.]
MAQTELMLRLLYNNKIVGYEFIDNGMHFQSENIDHLETCSFENCPNRRFVLWDSFELGVKVGKKLVF